MKLLPFVVALVASVVSLSAAFVREDGAGKVRFLANLSAKPVKVTVEGCETLALAPWQYVFD